MKKIIGVLALAFLAQAVLLNATCQAGTQSKKSLYPVIAPLSQYLMPDKNSEMALALSAAPASISGGAATNDPNFWNPNCAAPFASIRPLRRLLRRSS